MANYDKYINNKFVLVLSDEDDSTTDDVLDWLSYYSVPFLRLKRIYILSVIFIPFSKG